MEGLERGETTERCESGGGKKKKRENGYWKLNDRNADERSISGERGKKQTLPESDDRAAV